MKRITIFLIILVLSTTSFGQQTTPSQPLTKQDYLTKSKHQKTAAWILLGAGAAMFAITAPGDVSFSTAGVLVVGGGIAVLSSIPLFIASAKNKKRAKALSASFEMENAPVVQHAGFAWKSHPAVSIEINL